ncbi:hypothetical protein [Pseudomonas syringae]|uniref:hypothetical protein n=1 Tax=Pseudomonas syringae TaxID=317 RepID=UPI00200AC5F4|nr:hypothetical protein [Pseudomonas syringae]MCK9728525.1 hypothetical protein [Pseudomonas syringae pv. syringae]
MFENKSDADVLEFSFEMIKKENDRGAALLASMMAEHCLDELLKARLASPVGKEKFLSGFGAPIGTFAAKIELCFRLGCIPRGLAELLDGLRKIRNSFAHEMVADFETKAVADRTEAVFKINAAHYDSFLKRWSENILAVFSEHGIQTPEWDASKIKRRVRFDNYFAQIIVHLNANLRSCERVNPIY